MIDQDQRHIRRYVRFVLDRMGITASELARRANVATTTLTRFMNSDDHKHTLSAKTLAKIGAVAGMAYSSDMSFEGSNQLISPQKPDPIASIPLFDLRTSAGPGALHEDEPVPIGYQPYRTQELSRLTRANVEDLAVITVGGDSMWETLHDGDKVLVDMSVKRIVREGIYILAFEEELLVKRCQRDLETGEVIVKSDNPAYETIRVSSADKLTVIGRVIWIGRALG